MVSPKENQEWGMNSEQAETIEVCSGTEEGASALHKTGKRCQTKLWERGNGLCQKLRHVPQRRSHSVGLG